jgi:hypothetical protein
VTSGPSHRRRPGSQVSASGDVVETYGVAPGSDHPGRVGQQVLAVDDRRVTAVPVGYQIEERRSGAEPAPSSV